MKTLSILISCCLALCVAKLTNNMEEAMNAMDPEDQPLLEGFMKPGMLQDNPDSNVAMITNVDTPASTGEFETCNRVKWTEQAEGVCYLPCDCANITGMMVHVMGVNNGYHFVKLTSYEIIMECLNLREKAFDPRYGMKCNNIDQDDPDYCTPENGWVDKECDEALNYKRISQKSNPCKCPDMAVQYVCLGTQEDGRDYCERRLKEIAETKELTKKVLREALLDGYSKRNSDTHVDRTKRRMAILLTEQIANAEDEEVALEAMYTRQLLYTEKDLF